MSKLIVSYKIIQIIFIVILVFSQSVIMYTKSQITIIVFKLLL